MSGIVYSVAGLVLDISGTFLVALDLWRAPPQALQPPTSLVLLFRELTDALAAPGPERDTNIARIAERCSALALHDTAQSSRGSVEHGRLRTAGRMGLVLLVLGFFGQLAGTVVGSHATSTAQAPTPQAPVPQGSTHGQR